GDAGGRLRAAERARLRREPELPGVHAQERLRPRALKTGAALASFAQLLAEVGVGDPDQSLRSLSIGRQPEVRDAGFGDDVVQVVSGCGDEIRAQGRHDRRDPLVAAAGRRLKAEEALAALALSRADDELLLPAHTRVLATAQRVGHDLAGEIDRQRAVDAD